MVNLFRPSLLDEEKIFNSVYQKRELQFKVLVIGDFGVGKTSIVQRYVNGLFPTNYKITIGADFAFKQLQWDDATKINLQLWDVAGHERFGNLTGIFYRYAVGAAIVFDLTRPNTFNSIEKWLKDLRSKVLLPNGEPIPVIILANKSDIAMDETLLQIGEICKKNNILGHYVTSAKRNVNINAAMNDLVTEIMANHDNKSYNSNGMCQSIVLKQSPPERRKKRCWQ